MIRLNIIDEGMGNNSNMMIDENKEKNIEDIEENEIAKETNNDNNTNGKKEKKEKKSLTSNIKNPILREIAEWVEVLVIAFVLAMILKTFVVETTEVSGESMLKTLHDKEKLLVNRFIYKFDEPERGDIIVFLPDNEERNYIKRIVALPGETIDIRDGNVYIDDVLLEETYLDQETHKILRNSKEFPYKLRDDEYFAMGDNRRNSLDSRSEDVGVLTVDKIRGKAMCRIYPFDKMCIFGEVKYPTLIDENTDIDNIEINDNEN